MWGAGGGEVVVSEFSGAWGKRGEKLVIPPAGHSPGKGP